MDDLLPFSFNEKSSVLLIFFFHAIVFSSLLFINGIRESRNDSKWLAGFILLGGLYICPFMLGYAGWYSIKAHREFLFFVPFQQLFLIGPVFFFYTRSLLNNDFKLSRADWTHFLPAAAYFIYTLVVFIGDKLIFEEFYFYADGRDKDLDLWYQMAGLFSMLFYLYLSLKHYVSYRKKSLEEVSFADEVAFKWIQRFVIVFALILLLRVLFFVLNPEWGEFGSKYWYYLSFSILLLYISIAGYSNSLKTSFRMRVASIIETAQPSVPETVETESIEGEDQILGEWKERVIALFEKEDVHRNTDLTLTQVAALLGSNRSVISKVINQEFGMNFNDFVNEKRVKSVIEMLENGEHVDSTLLGIALDCGFNSKSTFNRVFKKYTGLTPNQYIVKNKL